MEATATLRSLARQMPGIEKLRHAPPYHTGPVAANRLGLQVARVLGKHLLWSMRRPATAPDLQQYAQLLDDDGVVAISNFLPAEEFARVRHEFEQVERELQFRPVPFYAHMRTPPHGRIHSATVPINAQLARFPATRMALLEDRRLHSLVTSAAHVRSVGLPAASIDVYERVDENAPDNDVETVLHADLHSPTVKAFFYLNDVDERNGAFVYAKGSARLSFVRLKHEYDLSVRVAKLKRGDTDIPADLLATRGPNQRNVVRPEYLRDMNVVETSLVGRANTLVIANNMGLHRRGDFGPGTRRETIMLNFRGLQRPFWS